jgi:hypothetical protein
MFKSKKNKSKKDTAVAQEEPDVVGGVAQFVAPKEKPVKAVVKAEVLLTRGLNAGSKFVNRVLHVDGKEARFATRQAAVTAKKRYAGKIVEKNDAFEVHK